MPALVAAVARFSDVLLIAKTLNDTNWRLNTVSWIFKIRKQFFLSRQFYSGALKIYPADEQNLIELLIYTDPTYTSNTTRYMNKNNSRTPRSRPGDAIFRALFGSCTGQAYQSTCAGTYGCSANDAYQYNDNRGDNNGKNISEKAALQERLNRDPFLGSVIDVTPARSVESRSSARKHNISFLSNPEDLSQSSFTLDETHTVEDTQYAATPSNGTPTTEEERRNARKMFVQRYRKFQHSYASTPQNVANVENHDGNGHSPRGDPRIEQCNTMNTINTIYSSEFDSAWKSTEQLHLDRSLYRQTELHSLETQRHQEMMTTRLKPIRSVSLNTDSVTADTSRSSSYYRHDHSGSDDLLLVDDSSSTDDDVEYGEIWLCVLRRWSSSIVSSLNIICAHYNANEWFDVHSIGLGITWINMVADEESWNIAFKIIHGSSNLFRCNQFLYRYILNCRTCGSYYICEETVICFS